MDLKLEMIKNVSLYYQNNIGKFSGFSECIRNKNMGILTLKNVNTCSREWKNLYKLSQKVKFNGNQILHPETFYRKKWGGTIRA